MTVFYLIGTSEFPYDRLVADYFSLGRYLAGESPTQGTSSIEVTLDGAGSTTLEWQLPAPKCHQFLTSVWIRVFEPVQSSRSSALYFQVPRSCLQKDALGSFSLQIPPTESPAETPCNFSFKLVECREYAVEIVPNYGGLRGKVLVARFKSMPQVNGFVFVNPAKKTIKSEDFFSADVRLDVERFGLLRRIGFPAR